MFVWDILGNDFQYAENPRITIIYRVHNSLQSLPFSVSASAPHTHTSFHLAMEPSPNLEGQVMKKKSKKLEYKSLCHLRCPLSLVFHLLYS